MARAASRTPTSGAAIGACATQPGKWSGSLAQSSAKPSLTILAYSSVCVGSLVISSNGGIG